jgi:hypothetical protein
MSGEASAVPVYYRPADVARILRCSTWWVREQARARRIPYCWIGGSYLFTAEHIAEILRLFEVQPTGLPESVPSPRRAPQRTEDGSSSTLVMLTARPPRRSRRATTPAA